MPQPGSGDINGQLANPRHRRVCPPKLKELDPDDANHEVEIVIEQLVRIIGQDRRPRYTAISERWTLLRILEVRGGSVEDLVEVDDEVHP